MSLTPRSPLPAAILHVADLSGIGGIPRVVTALAAGQKERGIAVHVAVRGPSPEAVDTLAVPFREIGVQVHPVITPPRAYWGQRTALAGLCKQLAPVVMHTHGLRSDIIGGLAARATHTPVVSTVHGFTEQGLKGRINQLIHSFALRAAGAVIAVSRPLESPLLAAGVRRQRLHVVPNAYRPRGELLSRAEARGKLGLPAGDRVIGWVGRLSPEKGPGVAVAGLSLVRDKSLTLSFLGEGPERGALEQQVQSLGLVNRVRFHGAVKDADLVYRAFDLFALSSHTEGTPIALFEAMHAGVPIVTTRVGGVPDVVGMAEARLVPADQPAALAESFDEVLEHPAEAEARALAAAARVASVFSPEPWLARHEELYRSLLPASPRA